MLSISRFEIGKIKVHIKEESEENKLLRKDN
jgi:hypothetical protein